MREKFIINRRSTTRKSKRALKRLPTVFLATLTLLSIWLTPSYATVTAVDSQTVMMSPQDLRTLITEITERRAETEAAKEALNSERELFAKYENSVNELIRRQEEERKTTAEIIQQLKRRLNAPALELYTGYSHDDEWEGGIRIVWRLN